MLLSLVTSALLAIGGVALAAPTKDRLSFVVRDGVNRTVFQHGATNATMDFVTNSGICETTPGVNQYSGYITVNGSGNYFFWFFEARSNPTTAPLAAWVQGGPGCSSLAGLFSENGPCTFQNGSSTTTLNPNSWNTYANMLYIDFPVGVGFSYGQDQVDSTDSASPLFWTLMQAFYAQFPQYTNRSFGLFTESHGGHYGPAFASYIADHNNAIGNGSVTGTKINMVALGINDGWIDPTIQYRSYIDYSHDTSYNGQIDNSTYASTLAAYNQSCGPALQTCTPAATGQQCSFAQSTCSANVQDQLMNLGDFSPDDVRSGFQNPFPSKTFDNYLMDENVQKAIGVSSFRIYEECGQYVSRNFDDTGDHARSFLPTLSSVVASNMTTLLWAGDSDWLCNWMGVQNVADAVTYPGQSAFQAKPLANYTVNGTPGGVFKTSGALSFLKVTGAGHMIPAYRPVLALQVFKQIMGQQPLSAT